MRGMGASFGRAAVIITAVSCALASIIALCTDASARGRSGRSRSESQAEQLRAPTNTDQRKDSDSNDQTKAGAAKVQDDADKDDKSGKTSDKSSKDNADSTDDAKDVSPKQVKREGEGKPVHRDHANDHGPPKTVEEWLKGLTKPNTPAVEPAQAVQPVLKAEPLLKAVPSKPSTHVVRDHPLALDAERAEVLANNLSKESLKLAVDQGFVLTGKALLTQLDRNYTKLGAPVGMGANEAIDFLAHLLPGQDFGANEAYRIYKTATAPDAMPHAVEPPPPPVPMATTCGTDRCFAQTLIGWRPQLQACAKNVRIGVIDTGIDQSHPAFKTRRIEARQEPKVHGPKRTMAPKWHGTGVLALLAGESHSNAPGLIPDASYFVADVFYADADGLPVSDTASILEALNWLAAKHVNIVNMSLTGPHDALLKAAIEDLSRKGMLFVAAVGNDGPAAPPTYPSAYPPVVAVSAINKDYSSYRYANRGDHVDLATPGVDIWTAMPEAQGAYHSGTSFAVPYATAMLASVFNGLTTKTKEDALAKLSYIDLGVPGRDPVYGRGLAIAPYGCELAPGTPLKPSPQPGTVNVTAVKN